jgi:cell division protein FtsA
LSRKRIITGLDIGSTKVCAIIAEGAAGEPPNILGAGISPCTAVKKGVVADISAVAAAIESAVAEAEESSGRRAGSAVVGVTGEHIISLNSRGSIAVNHPNIEISLTDIEKVLAASRTLVLPPDREIIHSIPRFYTVDGVSGVESPAGMYGTRLEVETHIVTGLSTLLQNVVKCINTAGIDVEGTIFTPLADAESVILPKERELGVALLDIGGGTTDIAVFNSGKVFHSGAIPVGGEYITKDISVGLNIEPADAERIKLEHGSLLPAVDKHQTFDVTILGEHASRRIPVSVLAEIIEPRVAEIFQLAVEYLQKSGCSKKIPGGLVITGGCAGTPGIEYIASSVAGLPARVGLPFGADGLVERVSGCSCATAVGLLLYCSRYHKKRIGNNASVFAAYVAGRAKELISRLSND